jgi:hypothetical protein
MTAFSMRAEKYYIMLKIWAILVIDICHNQCYYCFSCGL